MDKITVVIEMSIHGTILPQMGIDVECGEAFHPHNFFLENFPTFTKICGEIGYEMDDTTIIRLIKVIY